MTEPTLEGHTILERYWAKVGLERRAEAEVINAERHGDHGARVEAIRRRTAARLAAEAPEAEGEPEPRQPTDPEAVMVTACGTPAGTYAAIRNGVPVCPGCGSPITDGCLPAAEKEEGA